jgi:hypothetical protein
LTAGRHLALSAQGALADSRFATVTAKAGSLTLDTGGRLTVTGTTSGYGQVGIASGGVSSLAAVSSKTAGVNVASDASLKLGNVGAPGALVLSSQGSLATGTLSSNGSNVQLSAHNAGINYSSLTAAGTATLTATRDDGSVADTSIRGGNITARAVDPLAAIQVQAEAGSVVLGALTATTGGVDIASDGGLLTTGAMKAVSGIHASAKGTLTTGALTSSNAAVNLDSLTGSVTVASATARTGFSADAGAALSVGTFTVSAGGATLKAATSISLPKGTAYGLIDVTSGGNGLFGALTSTAHAVHASSTGGGLSFTALKAANGIRLRASKALGTGTTAAFGIAGTTVDAGVGGVDAEAAEGNLQFGKLSARSASLLNTLNGGLLVSSISLLTPSQLTSIAQGGTRVVPAGY